MIINLNHEHLLQSCLWKIYSKHWRQMVHYTVSASTVGAE